MKQDNNKFFYDPNIDRKSKISDSNFQFFHNSNIPMPSEIEISESGTCNRSCSFCPRSSPDYEDIKEFIEISLLEKLYKELQIHNYTGTIRFSGFVEPLLDKNIYKILELTKSILPKSNLEMVTNGDVLNISRLEKLYSSGLDVLLISVYDGVDDVHKFEEMGIKLKLPNEKFIIRHRYLPPEDDFGITLSNRSGMMENAEFKIQSLNKKLDKPCFIPSYTFFMDYNGDVLMCPHDWGKKLIMGNIKRNSFYDIWNSNKWKKVRNNLNKADRSISPCNVCDVKAP